MWDFRHRQEHSVPLWIEFLNIVISKTNSESVGTVLDRIVGSSDPEVFVDHVCNLLATEETGLLLGLLFFQTDSSFEVRILDDSVQCWSTPRIKYFKIRHWNTSYWWRRSSIVHWINHLNFFDRMHSFRMKLWTSTYLGLELFLPASKGSWRKELIKVMICDLQSLLVCPIIL